MALPRLHLPPQDLLIRDAAVQALAEQHPYFFSAMFSRLPCLGVTAQGRGERIGRGGDCRRGWESQGSRIRYVMADFDCRRPVARISGGGKNEGPALRTPRLVPVGYRGWVAGISASFSSSQNTCPDYGRTPMLRWKAPIRAGW